MHVESMAVELRRARQDGGVRAIVSKANKSLCAQPVRPSHLAPTLSTPQQQSHLNLHFSLSTQKHNSPRTCTRAGPLRWR